MTTRGQIILTLFTTVYLATIILTDLSLTGYWTDLVFSILLVSLGLSIIIKQRTLNTSLSSFFKTLTILCSIVIIGLIAINLIDPFSWNRFKIKSFYYEQVNGRLFNAYFKPVGSYSGGEGIIRISESPKYLPFIEIQKHHDGAVLWDFSRTEWEGEPVDQNEVLRNYILDEIIGVENN